MPTELPTNKCFVPHQILSPQLSITDRSKAVALLPVFGVRVSVKFHLMFVQYTFSSVRVGEWPPFGKELPVQLAVCSHCTLSIYDFSYFPFWSLLTFYFLAYITA